MFREGCWRIIFSLAVCLLVSRGELAAADDFMETEDSQLLDGLRKRALFQVAQSHCQLHLETPGLSVLQRTQWTIAWIRTHAQHALSLPADARPAQWQQARKVASDYLQRYPRYPQRTLVQVQDALTLLARGELLRQEAAISLQSSERLTTALETLRMSVRILEKLDATLSKMIPAARNETGDDDSLSQTRLMSLQHHVQFQLARAFRNQALCYPDGSDDQIAALQKALNQLAKPLKQLAPEDALVGPIQRDQSICLRWLGKLAAARKTVTPLHEAGREPQLQLQARAELIWIELASDRLAAALALAQQPRRIENITSPELDLARMEVSLVQWQQARKMNQTAAAQQWQQRAVDMVRFLESQHGAYWGRRAETRLLKIAGRDTSNLEILHRTADDLYLKGKMEEALAAYEQGAVLAEKAGMTSEAFQLWYKAALIEQKRNRLESYTKRLRQLATRLKLHPPASSVHLQAIQGSYQQLKDETRDRSGYRQLLEEHLAHWPQSLTASQARVWLGNELRRDGQLEQAIEIYQGVSVEFAQYVAVLELLETCWWLQLKSLASDPPQLQQAQGEAVQFFEAVVLGTEGQLPRRWSPATRQAVLTAARFRLQGSAAGLARVEAMIKAALQGQPAAEEGWVFAARGLLVLALAGQDKKEEAAAALKQLAGGEPSQILETIAALANLARQATGGAKTQLAQMQLTLIDQLQAHQGQLSAVDQLRFVQLRGRALADAGQQVAALQVFKHLAADHPRSGSIQETYAELLSAVDNPGSRQQALQQWRRVAQHSPPKSTRWYRAKYQVAMTYFRLGQPKQTAARLRYLQATSGWEDSGMKAQFEALLKRSQP
jgi:hypothetical protein